MIELKTKTVVVDGNSLVVSEENWDISIKLRLLDTDSRDNPLEDRRQQFFRLNFYNALDACSSGNVPTLEQALDILARCPGNIDAWYLATAAVNPQWFSDKFFELDTPEIVELRDGTRLSVSEIRLPSQSMLLYDLEDLANTQPAGDISAQLFRQVYYPKFAACTTPVLSEDEARSLPSSELDKWHVAVKRKNPGLFEQIEQVAHNIEKNKAAEAAGLKKKDKKPVK